MLVILSTSYNKMSSQGITSIHGITAVAHVSEHMPVKFTLCNIWYVGVE